MPISLKKTTRRALCSSGFIFALLKVNIFLIFLIIFCYSGYSQNISFRLNRANSIFTTDYVDTTSNFIINEEKGHSFNIDLSYSHKLNSTLDGFIKIGTYNLYINRISVEESNTHPEFSKIEYSTKQSNIDYSLNFGIYKRVFDQNKLNLYIGSEILYVNRTKNSTINSLDFFDLNGEFIESRITTFNKIKPISFGAGVLFRVEYNLLKRTSFFLDYNYQFLYIQTKGTRVENRKIIDNIGETTFDESNGIKFDNNGFSNTYFVSLGLSFDLIKPIKKD